MKLIPIRDYEWGSDLATMKTLTCLNHPTAKYLTKNPFCRSVFVVKVPDGMVYECPCPMSDLAVVVPDNPEPDKSE